jgi:hypothetical protein
MGGSLVELAFAVAAKPRSAAQACFELGGKGVPPGFLLRHNKDHRS